MVTLRKVNSDSAASSILVSAFDNKQPTVYRHASAYYATVSGVHPSTDILLSEQGFNAFFAELLSGQVEDPPEVMLDAARLYLITAARLDEGPADNGSDD